MTSKKLKLAIFGGPKTTNNKGHHFNWPIITKNIEYKVLNQLRENISIYDRSGIFEKFENAFARYHKRKHALLCSSGTAAIHSMFAAAGFKEGDEIICPAYTFFATVTPLLFTGAKPILCDCDENGNIDPEEIEKLISKKTKGLIITHMWGIPCQMDKITEICRKNKILLLEDCSHAHGARYKNKPVGSFGDLTAWSLQGQKNISGGEGGILTTNNDNFYYRALLFGHYNKRCKQEIPKDNSLYRFCTTGMGLKYRAHPLAITISMEMFKKLDKFIAIKNHFYNKFKKELHNISGLKFPKIDSYTQPSWYALVFQYNVPNLPIDKFMEMLLAEGLIEFDRPNSTSPLNLLPLFQNPEELFDVYKIKNNHFSYKKGNFPRAEKFYDNAIKLPVWTFRKDEKIVNLYIRGLKKVLRYINSLNK